MVALTKVDHGLVFGGVVGYAGSFERLGFVGVLLLLWVELSVVRYLSLDEWILCSFTHSQPATQGGVAGGVRRATIKAVRLRDGYRGESV